MNVENILKVADAIEAACAPDAKPEIGFNMAWTRVMAGDEPDRQDLTDHDCGTVCCIKGWAEYLFPKAYDGYQALGLSNRNGFRLFAPDDYGSGKYTPEKAVAVLRHLAATGKVDWSVGAPAPAGKAVAS